MSFHSVPGPHRPRPSPRPRRRPAPPLLVLALGVLATPGAASAQQEPESEDAPSAKSAVGAAALELYVPVAGYAYAGDWKRGIPAAALWGAGIAGLAYGSGCVARGSDDGCSSARRTAGELGWLAAAVSRLWGGVGAFRTAREHNRGRAARARVEVRPRPGGGLDVSLRLRGAGPVRGFDPQGRLPEITRR